MNYLTLYEHHNTGIVLFSSKSFDEAFEYFTMWSSELEKTKNKYLKTFQAFIEIIQYYDIDNHSNYLEEFILAEKKENYCLYLIESDIEFENNNFKRISDNSLLKTIKIIRGFIHLDYNLN